MIKSYNLNVNKLILGDIVTDISNRAFDRCTNLVDISFHNISDEMNS